MAGVPLLNPRWEKFCQAYVSGPTAGNATASYVEAGFAGEGTQTARSGAFRLLNKDIIRKRVGEIQAAQARLAERALAKVADRLSLRDEAILGQLLKMGFANMFDYVRRDENGELVVDLGAIDRDQAVGIVELVIHETGEGETRKRTMRVRLGNRHAPLVSLGKHLGLFAEKPEKDDRLRNKSTEDLQRQVTELYRKRSGKEIRLDPEGASKVASPASVQETERGSPRNDTPEPSVDGGE
jgi:hypothetical protein